MVDTAAIVDSQFSHWPGLYQVYVPSPPPCIKSFSPLPQSVLSPRRERERFASPALSRLVNISGRSGQRFPLPAVPFFPICRNVFFFSAPSLQVVLGVSMVLHIGSCARQLLFLLSNVFLRSPPITPSSFRFQPLHSGPSLTLRRIRRGLTLLAATTLHYLP